MMRERPILFAGPMVRALLDGRKTVTRRVVDPLMFIETTNPDRIIEQSSPDFGAAAMEWARCPYGQPGDRLWVRETWYCDHCFERDFATTRKGYVNRTLTDAECIEEWKEAGLFYRADGEPDWEGDGPTPWKPSIHMPRWASRLTLEVVNVRIERLHDITEEDAIAEGVEQHHEPFTEGWRNYEPSPTFESVAYHATARESFASLWRSINGAESWAANPWAWRVEFNVVKESNDA